MYTYLWINILAVLPTLLLSFDRKVYFYKRWKYLFPGILITGAFFIAWDVIFTAKGVWGFNERYLSGIDLINLPMEEWLFFFTIPYASVFTYDVFKAYIRKDLVGLASKYITFALIFLLGLFMIMNTGKLYTFWTFLFTVLFLLLQLFVIRGPYMGRFYFTYLVVLFPFMLVNGILTGSFIEEQVVWYNDNQNLSVRIFTIPVEDLVYGMLLILMNVTLYEKFQKMYGKAQSLLRQDS